MALEDEELLNRLRKVAAVRRPFEMPALHRSPNYRLNSIVQSTRPPLIRKSNISPFSALLRRIQSISPPVMMPRRSGFSQMSGNIKGGGDLARLIAAISRVESGGNYKARNRATGAMGKYQILPGNIAGKGGWDREALGRDISVSQFMNNPDLQDRIARYMINKYMRAYGPQGAAFAWYSGPGAARRRMRRGQGFNSGYVSKVMRYY